MSDFNFEQAGYSDLLTEAKRLNAELDSVKQELARVQVAFQNRDRQRDEVSEVVQELIDNKTITDPDALSILVRNLDVTASRTVSFSLTVEITGEIELEYDESLDDYGFSIDGLSYNGSYVNDWNEGHIDVDWDEE